MKALISDIHGNMEALSVVLDDIEAQHGAEILCLGDIVGYGPEPEACIDTVMTRARWSLMGNHDNAILHGPEGFNPIAADVIRLTAERMQAAMEGECDGPSGVSGGPRAGSRTCPACLSVAGLPRARWNYLENLALSRHQGDVLYVHGSVLNPVSEYVFPDRFRGAWRPARIKELMDAAPWIVFCGHTHFPCAITSDLRCHYPQAGTSRLRLERGLKYIVNLGSVGQPRDGDTRASYVLFDENKCTVEWRRLCYDIHSVAKKIEAMCGKGNWCARRLWKGQ